MTKAEMKAKIDAAMANFNGEVKVLPNDKRTLRSFGFESASRKSAAIGAAKLPPMHDMRRRSVATGSGRKHAFANVNR
jgi:hypothetical protein